MNFENIFLLVCWTLSVSLECFYILNWKICKSFLKVINCLLYPCVMQYGPRAYTNKTIYFLLIFDILSQSDRKIFLFLPISTAVDLIVLNRVCLKLESFVHRKCRVLNPHMAWVLSLNLMLFVFIDSIQMRFHSDFSFNFVLFLLWIFRIYQYEIRLQNCVGTLLIVRCYTKFRDKNKLQLISTKSFTLAQ